MKKNKQPTHKVTKHTRPGRLRSWSGPVETDFQGRLRFSCDSRPGHVVSRASARDWIASLNVGQSLISPEKWSGLSLSSPPSAGGTLDRTSFAATRSVCLEGALARPCTISVVTGPAPKFCCHASRQHGPGQGRRLQDSNFLILLLQKHIQHLTFSGHFVLLLVTQRC